jgi:hypothetical protein
MCECTFIVSCAGAIKTLATRKFIWRVHGSRSMLMAWAAIGEHLHVQLNGFGCSLWGRVHPHTSGRQRQVSEGSLMITNLWILKLTRVRLNRCTEGRNHVAILPIGCVSEAKSRLAARRLQRGKKGKGVNLVRRTTTCHLWLLQSPYGFRFNAENIPL